MAEQELPLMLVSASSRVGDTRRRIRARAQAGERFTVQARGAKARGRLIEILIPLRDLALLPLDDGPNLTVLVNPEPFKAMPAYPVPQKKRLSQQERVQCRTVLPLN